MLTPEQVASIRRVERAAAEKGQYEAAEAIRLLLADRTAIAQELERIEDGLEVGRMIVTRKALTALIERIK